MVTPSHCLAQQPPQIKLWAELKNPYKLRWNTPRGLSFAPDARTLATSDGETLFLWELLTRKVRAAMKTELAAWSDIDLLRFSADGRELYCAGGARVEIWDLASQSMRKRLTGHEDWVFGLAVSPGGSRLASGDKSGVVKVWSTGSGEELMALGPSKKGFRAHTVQFSPDGKSLAVGGYTRKDVGDVASFPGEVQLWDLEKKSLARTFAEAKSRAKSVSFSPAGDLMAVAHNLGPVLLVDPGSGKVIRTLKHRISEVFAMEFFPKGGIVAVGGPLPNLFVQAGEIQFFDAMTGAEMASIKDPDWTRRIAFSPDGNLLAAAGNRQPVKLWDVSALVQKAAEKNEPRGKPGKKAPTASPKAGPPPKLGELKEAWDDLAGDDAQRAYKALWKLVQAPEQAVALLATKLRPAAVADPKEVARLVNELDAGQAAIREKAFTKLKQLGAAAKKSLAEALDRKLSAEAATRIKKLLDGLDGVPQGSQLQALRAVEVLEYIGTKEALAVLAELSKGYADDPLTIEAKKTLARFQGQEASKSK